MNLKQTLWILISKNIINIDEIAYFELFYVKKASSRNIKAPTFSVELLIFLS